ncbi:Rid family hydrolase [Streptomyces sp. NPDC059258]|uniref:Rid family hydrolase n=1 Tax=unclassified Streptomyces TaxID=2593676 RepID=UPI0036CF772E
MAKDQVESWGVPWEQAFGYVQAVRHGDTIHVAGQFSHDGDGLVAPVPVDEQCRVTDFGTMEEQMRTTYTNTAKLLSRFGATMDDVVEEVVYVLDRDSAFAAAGPVRRRAFATGTPQVATTILVTPGLAQPGQLVEISCTARLSA